MKTRTYLRAHIPLWLDRIQPSESVVLGGAALLVGLTAGIGVWLFKLMIEWTHLIMFERLGTWLANWGAWTVLFVPILGGLVVGIIAYLAYNSLVALINKVLFKLELTATDFIDLLQEPAK